MFATFGPIRLHLTGTTGLELTDGWHYAEHAVIQGKPLLQALGEELRKLSISFRFHAEFCDPVTEMEALRGLAGSRAAAALVLGTGRMLGRFVIAELAETARWTLPDGAVLSLDAKATLKEWAEDAAAAPAAVAIAGYALAIRRG